MEVLRTAILDFCGRRKGKTFCPSEVVRQLFPQDWELFMVDIREEMMQMYREGLIQVSQKGNPIDPGNDPIGPVRISSVPKPK
jgi:hypothetical protein